MEGFGVKRCKVCRQPFEPRQPMAVVCSLECAKSLAASIRGKAEKQEAIKQRKLDRERKGKLKTRRDWEKEAQVAFNAYIRARDADKPCVCCGLPLSAGAVGGGYDCGHYRSTGSAPHMRFIEDNAHGQRKQCNRWGAGRAVDYRLGLIERIGLARVEAIEVDQTPRKYTADELKAIRDKYRAKARKLKREAV